MIHDPGHALVRGEGLVGVAERREADIDKVGGYGSGGAVPVVAKVFQQNAQLLRRRVMKQVVLEMKCVFVGTDEVGYQVFMRRAVIENFDVLGGLNEDLGLGCERKTR